MAKKEKLGIEKIINRLNKEFGKTSSQFEKLIKDALKQLENIQTQIHEPVKKLKEDIEKVRERELKRFHNEFDKKIEEFNKIQSSILEKLGIHSAKTSTASSSQIQPVSNPAPSKQIEKTVPEKTKPKAKKNQPARTKNTSALTKLKGVGPAMQKKLNEAGILSLSQVANPSKKDIQILQNFSNVKGFDTWNESAKTALA